jgi:hypothetical protein
MDTDTRITKTLAALATPELKKLARSLYDRPDATDELVSEALSELERRISSPEFVAFCDSL